MHYITITIHTVQYKFNLGHILISYRILLQTTKPQNPLFQIRYHHIFFNKICLSVCLLHVFIAQHIISTHIYTKLCFQYWILPLEILLSRLKRKDEDLTSVLVWQFPTQYGVELRIFTADSFKNVWLALSALLQICLYSSFNREQQKE